MPVKFLAVAGIHSKKVFKKGSYYTEQQWRETSEYFMDHLKNINPKKCITKYPTTSICTNRGRETG